jgi:hypothetical protein
MERECEVSTNLVTSWERFRKDSGKSQERVRKESGKSQERFRKRVRIGFNNQFRKQDKRLKKDLIKN